MDLSRPTGLGTQSPTDHPRLPTYHTHLPTFPPGHPLPPGQTYLHSRPAEYTYLPGELRYPPGGNEAGSGWEAASRVPGRPPPTMLASHISLWPFHKHLPCLDSIPSPTRLLATFTSTLLTISASIQRNWMLLLLIHQPLPIHSKQFAHSGSTTK